MTARPIRSVLVVDDDTQFAQAISAVMRLNCDVVDIANSMEVAWGLLNRRAYTLVLLDLWLGDSRPVETLAAVRLVVASGSPRVVLMTATLQNDDALAKVAVEAGAERVITKSASAMIRELRGLFPRR